MAVPLMFRRRSMDKNWQGSNQETLDDAENEELSEGNQDLFELLERLQNSRLDDQRCVLPSALQLPAVYTDDNCPRSSARYESLQAQELRRCETELLQKILRGPKPYPMVVLPPSGGYHVIDGDDSGLVPNSDSRRLVSWPSSSKQSDFSLIEADVNATLYRKYFLDQEHFNFIMIDNTIGPIVMSVKYETINGKEHLRVILRRKHSILSGMIPNTFDPESMQALKIAKILCDDITADKYYGVLFPKASELILAFDEHVLVKAMKFGIVYQKPGQITEEEMFGNETHSPAMEEFLQLLGKKVELKGFDGFRGGLDTADGLTGSSSFYTTFEDVEIMFHVSTLLPYSESDPQQLQRKRHIGNDVVTIVFQDENTPFMPSMIASHFLHAFIVIQAIDPLTPNTRYRISVTCRDDVQSFGPAIPKPPILNKSEETRKFLLSKLINAEISSLKGRRFSSLERRTKDSLLHSLYETLLARTIDFCGFSLPNCSNKSEAVGTTSGFFDSVRKALSGRNRSHSVESNIANTTPKRSSSRASNSSLTGTITGDTTPSTLRAQSSQVLDAATSTSPVNCQFKHGKTNSSGIPVSNSSTPPSLQPTMGESDSSSMNSFDLERPAPPEDSDTGMESMSSADAPCASSNLQPPYCLFFENENVKSLEELRASGNMTDMELEIAKLKLDKLYLLKEVSACQLEMKRLKSNEIKLSTELAIIKQDNKRLTAALASYQNGHDSIV